MGHASGWADAIRSNEYTREELANLIEDAWTSTGPVEWDDYSGSITYGGTGSMTYTTVSTTYARYLQIGKVVFMGMRAGGTVGGTLGNALQFSLPVTAANASYDGIGSGWNSEGSNEVSFCTLSDTTTVNVLRTDGSNYTAGSTTIAAFICYEAA